MTHPGIILSKQKKTKQKNSPHQDATEQYLQLVPHIEAGKRYRTGLLSPACTDMPSRNSETTFSFLKLLATITKMISIKRRHVVPQETLKQQYLVVSFANVTVGRNVKQTQDITGVKGY